MITPITLLTPKELVREFEGALISGTPTAQVLDLVDDINTEPKYKLEDLRTEIIRRLKKLENI